MDVYWKEYVEFIKGRDPDNFYLRQYTATIMQEDGTEREETVNEAANIVKFMKGEKPSQGLRINGQKKHQITRNFKDEQTGLTVIYSKVPNGGACLANAGKCILIGTFNEVKNHSSPECNDTIQLMAMYLNKSTWPDKDDLPGTGLAGGDTENVSWQTHIEKSLVGRGNIADAMLLSVETGEILGSTAQFKLLTYEAEIPQEDGTDRTETIDELKNMKQLMNKSKPSQGLRVNQQKYQIIKSFEDEVSNCYTVYGKKTLGGIAIATTGKVIIIATFDEKKQHTSPACNENVSMLAKYFKASMK